jgi:hypothetical protein
VSDSSERLDLSEQVYHNSARVNALLVPKVDGVVSQPAMTVQTESNLKIDLQVLPG